jgi:hypothetical protein
MGAGSSSVNSEMKKYVDGGASPEDLVLAAEGLDADSKALALEVLQESVIWQHDEASRLRLLEALQESPWQHAFLFYQEGGAEPEDEDSTPR